ncbi:hypothetical protein CAC42_7352 [Sphaceloma murrayae]|uniref:Uncharacterized protein n=1 Tax=Sphaceloma murrayae TaxID=2082308 RepID=A0A2K1QWS4_9PEZI|nr:hypothetical protein CAC42_7352 [Sphaceloma murrayae]
MADGQLQDLCGMVVSQIVHDCDRMSVPALAKLTCYAPRDVAELLLRSMCILQETGQLTTRVPTMEELLAPDYFNMSMIDSAGDFLGDLALVPSLEQSLQSFGPNGTQPTQSSAVISETQTTSLSHQVESPPSPFKSLASADVSFTKPATGISPLPLVDPIFNFNPVLREQARPFEPYPAPYPSPESPQMIEKLFKPSPKLTSSSPSLHCSVARSPHTPPTTISPPSLYLDQPTNIISPANMAWPSTLELSALGSLHATHIANITVLLTTSAYLVPKAIQYLDMLLFKLGVGPRPGPHKPGPGDLGLLTDLFANEEQIRGTIIPVEDKIIKVLEALHQNMLNKQSAVMAQRYLPKQKKGLPKGLPKGLGKVVQIHGKAGQRTQVKTAGAGAGVVASGKRSLGVDDDIIEIGSKRIRI